SPLLAKAGRQGAVQHVAFLENRRGAHQPEREDREPASLAPALSHFRAHHPCGSAAGGLDGDDASLWRERAADDRAGYRSIDEHDLQERRRIAARTRAAAGTHNETRSPTHT